MKEITFENTNLGLDIIENSNNPIIIMDGDFIIIDSNKSAKYKLLDQEEKSIFELFENILKDEKDMWIDMIASDYMSIQGVELFTKHKDKKHVYYINVLEVGDSKIAFVFNEITEIAIMAKKAEKLESIMDEYVLMTKSDLDGNITDVSEAFAKASGYTKEELIGQPYTILRHEYVDPLLFDDMWETIQNGEQWQGIITNRKKNGESFIIDTTIKPEKNYSNKHYGYISISNLFHTM